MDSGLRQDIRGATFVVAPIDSVHPSEAIYVLTGVAAADAAILQDLNDRANGGIVKILDGNVDLTDLDIDNCTMTGQGTTDVVGGRKGTTFHVTGGIHVAPGGRLWNITVEVAAAYAGTAVTVGGDEEIFVNIPKLLDNIVIYSPENELGTGLLLLGDGTTTPGYIALCTFGPIQVRGFEYSVKQYATGPGTNGFVNGNHLESVVCNSGKYMLTLQAIAPAAVAANTIGSAVLQPSATTVDGIILINAHENIFEAAYAFDWAGGAVADAFKADAASYRNHVVRGRLDVVSDSGYQNRICNQNIFNERILIVKKEGGDYNKLSSALLAATGNAVDARWTVKVYGRIDEDGQIVAKSYVDVIGYNAVIYNSYAGHSVTASNITDCWWRDIIVRKTASAGGYEGALFTGGTTDESVRFDNCSFFNDDSTNSSNYGGYIGGSPTFNQCHFRGGQGGANGFGVTAGYGKPRFLNCLCEGGSGGGTCHGWYLSGNGYIYLENCIGKASDNQAGGKSFQISGAIAVDLINSSTELYKYLGTWDYDDADNGRFRPYAGHPYQLIGITVRVDVAHVGETLDIGTSIAGNQVVNNVDIGTTGTKTFAFSKSEVAADGYLYATPSAPINDGDVHIAYTVVKNYSGGALTLDGNGFVRIVSAYLLSNGSSAALHISAVPTMLTWYCTESHLETLHPTVENALFMTAPAASVPLSRCTLIGKHNAISFAPDDGWVEFTVNVFQYPNPGTDWTPQLAGALLGSSLANKKCWLPLNFLKQGDEIISYRLTGDTTEVNNIVLNCKLVLVGLADPLSTTDVAGGAIAAVTIDGPFDSLATLTNAEVVATDRQYTLEIEGSTGVTDSIKVMGAEIRINRVG